MPRPLRSGLIGLVAATALLVTACGTDEPDASDEPTPAETSAAAEPSATEPPSATAAPAKKPAGTSIDITLEGDSVDPDGVEKKVKAGEPITLHIVADKAGELHVHSSPEQVIRYPAGTTDKKLTIDRPGIVEVEAHELDQLIVLLEVR